MSKDIEKYTNWRAITESDYVTMFIKTWFAFVATLRELYPKENLDDVIGKGDNVFLRPYLADFEQKFICYNKIDKVKEDILKVYKLGRTFTLENKKYNRFFVEDFYTINKKYVWEKNADEYECSIKYSSDFKITVHAKYYDRSLYINNEPLIVIKDIDVSDLLDSSNLSDKQIKTFIDDEAAFINEFTTQLIKRVSFEFIGEITKADFNSKFASKELELINRISLAINADLISALALHKDSNIQRNQLLFSQNPCSNFIYKAENNEPSSEVDVYNWFLKFVYFMRNALFHEIIDPLDSFWQMIFKHSYLVLKEILDGNIKYLLDQDVIKGLIYYKAWDEFKEKQDVFIPNLNEHYANGEVEIKFVDYRIDASGVNITSEITYDYWYNKHVIRYISCKAKSVVVWKDKWVIDKFKLELIKKEDKRIG